jgi:lysyl-tRNA synthetase class 2
MELSSIERIMNERRQKALKLKELGFNPYVNGYRPSIDNKSFIEKYDKFSKEELLEVLDSFSIAGRVMSVRSMGKAAFIIVKDATASLQVFLQKEHLSDNDFAAFKLLDMGDFVFASGKPMKTKTGELSLNIDNFKILTKTLRPLPEKWHGLTNVEERYRHREVDLIVNDKAAWIFRTRSKIIRYLQNFLDQRGFIEVETPVLTDIAGGAEAKPFLTHHNALSEDLCMRIATEIPLKRLIVGGMEKVYEIGRMFRNEGVSTKHNPEFTSIEFYQAYATYEDFIELTQEFFKGLVQHIHGTEKLEYQGHILDFSKPFRKVPIAQLVAEHLGFDEQKTKELIGITSVKEALNITHKKLVSEEEAVVLCLKDLSVEEMNSILPEFLEEPAHSHMDLVSVSKKIVKTKDFSDVLVIGEKIDKALSSDRRRSLALNLLYGVFDHQVEQHIIQPTFITDFCVSNSPLARKRDGDEAVVDRFELIIAKMEVANAFSELNDADDQRERFVRQAQMKFMGEEEACEVDETFLHSLEVGMPPAAGQGIGIDRLVMLLTNSASIREVILFPKMKRK